MLSKNKRQLLKKQRMSLQSLVQRKKEQIKTLMNNELH